MPYRRPAPFDPDRACAWLCSREVIDREGAVQSWVNPHKPGFAYAEIGGLLLSLIDDDAVAGRVASEHLRLAEADAVGRDGTGYLFDEGVVLAGLLRHARRVGKPSIARIAPLLERFVTRLHRREVTDRTLPERWSTRSGPHLLKLAVTVGAWNDVTAEHRATLSGLLDETAARCDRGRFVTSADSQRTYVHAHCYATEGALRLAAPDLLARSQRAHARALAAASAAWLASIQRPDGGLPAWHDGARGWGPQPADVAAQALRIWALTDRRAYAPSIDRATRFIDGLAAPCGALRYHGDSADLNTWATAFAVQGVRFAMHGGDACALL